MPNQRLLAGALSCALLFTTSVDAKEPRGLQREDVEAARTLPVRVVVLQPRLQPQFRYGYIPTADAGLNAGNNLYSNPGGMSYGQAMGAGLVGGLIAGAIINGAEKASAKQAVRTPYQVISQAKCDLPLADSHQAMVAGALQRAHWPEAALGTAASTGAGRYQFTVSTSFAPDFSALMTTVDTAAYVPDAAGKVGRKSAWQDSLIVVSDGLWLPAKTTEDIERMVAAEKQRYEAEDADALIDKVNAAGRSASRTDRMRAVSMSRQHAENMSDAKDAGWSDASTAMRRATLWSENDCALLKKTLQSNLEHAQEIVVALLEQSLPAPGETPPTQASPGRATPLASARIDDDAVTETTTGVGVAEDPAAVQPAASPARSIEAIGGGTYVSRLSGENIDLGYRHMVLDE